MDGIEKVFMKEIPSSEDREPQQIKLIFVGKPDMAVLNNTVNDLIEKSGREIIYRCYSLDEFDKRLRMDDAYVLDVSAGKKII